MAGAGASPSDDDPFVVVRRGPGGDAGGDDTDADALDAADDVRLRRSALLWRTFEDVPEGLALLLALAAATFVCLGPFAVLAMAGCIPRGRISWAALAAPDASGVHWGAELLRWSLLAHVLLCGAAAVHFLRGPVRALSLAAAQRAASENGEGAPSGAVRALETLAAVWLSAGSAALITVLWAVSLALLPYKTAEDIMAAQIKPKETLVGGFGLQALPDALETEAVQPLSAHYLGERGLLVAALLAWVLVGARVLVHTIGRQFNAPLYAERLARFVRASWSLDVLLRAQSVFSGRPRPHAHPYFGRLWGARAYPHAFAERMPHALLEVFLELGGRAPGPDAPALRRLFRFLAGRDGAFCEADVAPYFAAGDAAWGVLFDGAPAGGMTLPALRRFVDDVAAERRTLVAVLLANGRVLRSLDRVLVLAVVAVLLPMLVFFVFGLRASQNSMAAYASFWPLAMIAYKALDETVGRLTAAIVFLFATHPYDVGDRVYIAPRAESYYVRGLGLLSTTFERWDGLIVSWPNAELAREALCNVRRTAAQSQLLELVLPALRRGDLVAELARRLAEWVDARPGDYAAVRLVPFELRAATDLVCLVVLRHRTSFQDGTLRRNRQSRFLAHVRAALEDLGVEYASAVRPLSLSVDDPIVADAIARLELGLPSVP